MEHGIEQPNVERPQEGQREAAKPMPESVRRTQETLAKATRERAEAALNERVDARMALHGVITAKTVAEYAAAAVELQKHLDALTSPERKALRAKADAMSGGPAVMGSPEEMTAINVIASRVAEWKRESEAAAAAEPPSVIGRFLRQGIGRR